MLPTNPRTIREAKLREEVEALEAVQKGESPTQSIEVKEGESSSKVAEITTEQKEVVEIVQDLKYWKDQSALFENRWKVSKAKYDSNIFKLRQENVTLKSNSIQVKKRLNQVLQAQAASKPSKLDEVFGQEQIDVLGQSTVDVIKDTIAETNKRVDEQEAKAESDQIAREEQDLKNEQNKEFNNFIARLKKLVPDLKKINTDKGFLTWLKEPDELSGDIREDILARAEYSRDVGRVAGLFLQYIPEKVPAADSVSKRIAPSNTEGSDTITGIAPKDTISMAQVDKFYDDVARGKYKGRYTEKKTMEAKIDKAWASGRIT